MGNRSFPIEILSSRNFIYRTFRNRGQRRGSRFLRCPAHRLSLTNTHSLQNKVQFIAETRNTLRRDYIRLCVSAVNIPRIFHTRRAWHSGRAGLRRQDCMRGATRPWSLYGRVAATSRPDEKTSQVVGFSTEITLLVPDTRQPICSRRSV